MWFYNVVMCVGAGLFGVVVGYLTYRTLARTTDKARITDLAAVLSAVGGGAVTGLIKTDRLPTFGLYAIGLPLGMASYLFLFRRLQQPARRNEKTAQILTGDDPTPL